MDNEYERTVHDWCYRNKAAVPFVLSTYELL